MPMRIEQGDELQRHMLLQREIREEVLAEQEARRSSVGDRHSSAAVLFDSESGRDYKPQTDINLKREREDQAGNEELRDMPKHVYIDYGDPSDHVLVKTGEKGDSDRAIDGYAKLCVEYLAQKDDKNIDCELELIFDAETARSICQNYPLGERLVRVYAYGPKHNNPWRKVVVFFELMKAMAFLQGSKLVRVTAVRIVNLVY